MIITPEDRERYFEQGYLIVRNLLSKEQINKTKKAIERQIDRARSGEGDGIPGLDKDKEFNGRFPDLMRPEYYQEEYGDTLEDTPIIDIVEYLLEEPIRYSGNMMLASGNGQPYVQNWHRDMKPVDESITLTENLKFIRSYCQLNVPLFEDRYFTFVPGSHLRRTTAEELKVLHQNMTGSMPDAITVELAPGEAVFYINKMFHRGYNPEGNFRWTLHYGFWTAKSPIDNFTEGHQREWLKHLSSLDMYGPRVRSLLEGYIMAEGSQLQQLL